VIQSTRQFGLFAKYWQPGQVKTRLAATEGPQRAAELYKAFLQTSLERFAEVDARRVLGFTPRDRGDEFGELAGASWHLEPQSQGDLGRRMRDYFTSALAAGFQEVLLVGSDSPTLPLERIDQAFAALKNKDVVLGPTQDGGYYLVGAARRVPDIFENMPWSTSHLWRRTVDRLRAGEIGFCSLEPWYDVDDRTTLNRLRVELCRPDTADSALRALSDVVGATNSR
jgi:rSAM/selenodomain-associated transferase 1